MAGSIKNGRQLKSSNLLELIETNRNDEAAELLINGIHLVGAIGDSSLAVALEAATKLFAGDLSSTIQFMNYRHPWLDGQTPLEHTEDSNEGRNSVLNMISAIESGAYL